MIEKYIRIGGIVLQDMGEWSDIINYEIGNLVSSLGITYRCVMPCQNQEPPNISYWTQYTAGGESVIFSDGIPSDGIGINGQIALDYANYDQYLKVSGHWTLQGNYRGPQGNPGTGYTNIVYDEQPAGDRNGINKTFTLGHSPASNKGFLFIFVGAGGAVPMVLGLDYTISGSTLTYTSIALNSSNNEDHRIMYNY